MPSDRPMTGMARSGPGRRAVDDDLPAARQPTVFTMTVEVARDETVTVNWAGACGADPGNSPPVADFTFFPTAPQTGEQVNFTSISEDPDGGIQTTEWDLEAPRRGADGHRSRAAEPIVVDLSACDFIDSSGIRALLIGRQAAEDNGGSLALAAPKPQVVRILDVTGVASALPIHASAGEALAAKP